MLNFHVTLTYTKHFNSGQASSAEDVRFRTAIIEERETFCQQKRGDQRLTVEGKSLGYNVFFSEVTFVLCT